MDVAPVLVLDVPPLAGTLVLSGDGALATNAFGEVRVHRGTWSTIEGQHVEVAVKCPILRRDRTAEEARETAINSVRDEAAMWIRLRHPQIVPFLGYRLGEQPCLVMPLYRNGNLQDFLSRTPSIGNTERLRLIRQIGRAVEYLHSCEPPIIHCDIKLANALVTDDQDAHLTDFGLAAVFVDETSGRRGVGTRGYQSAEILTTDDCSPASDVFAFGCLIVAAFSEGRTPFINMGGIRIALECHAGTFNRELFTGVSDSLWTLATWCWSLVPYNRPTMAQVLSALETELATAH